MKIASRWLLPLELYVAVVMIGWGLAGSIGTGHFASLLRSESDPAAWGWMLCALGAGQFLIAGIEAGWGRRWCERWIHASVSARCVAAFLSAATWLYVCWVLAIGADTGVALAIFIQAPCAVVANLYIYAGNLKVRYLLDPEIPTTRLQASILVERLHATRWDT